MHSLIKFLPYSQLILSYEYNIINILRNCTEDIQKQ
jgi:hypothetical protein